LVSLGVATDGVTLFASIFLVIAQRSF